MTARAYTPLFATANVAAEQIGLPTKRFLEYVKGGILPGPLTIGRDELFDMEALAKAMRGEPWGLDGKDWA